MGSLFFRYVLCLAGAISAIASPRLQLSQTALYSSVPAPAQTLVGTIYASNAGDGNLNLTVTNTVSWLAVVTSLTVGCDNLPQYSQCQAIQVSVDTTSLPNGSIAGSFQVNAAGGPNAIQNVVVVLDVGGYMPDLVHIYVSPGGAAEHDFGTGNNTFGVGYTATPPAGVTLQVALPSHGTFPFTTRDYYFVVVVSAAPETPEGAYSGAIAVSRLYPPENNKTVGIEIDVTSQPIATYSMGLVSGASTNGRVLSMFADAVVDVAPAATVDFWNSGQGRLALYGGVSDSDWLSASVNGLSVKIVADSSNLAVGSYYGSVTVTSNAANLIVIPVVLDVPGLRPPTLMQNAFTVAGAR